MATKDELVAFGQANGIAVDMSMLKGDIETAISAAGYDPTTIGEQPPMTETPPDPAPPEDVERTSSDSRFSTYAEVPADPDESPTPGRQVEETRGVAHE